MIVNNKNVKVLREGEIKEIDIINVKDENIFGGNSRIHTSIYIEARKHYDSVPLKDDGYIDYDDMINYILEKFESDPSFAQNISNQ